MMTDPIADMLTRIRNAVTSGHKWVDMPVSKLKVEVARILKENHFVFDYKVLDDGMHGLLRVYLKYTSDDTCVITGLKRVSKPGRRVYVPKPRIPRARKDLARSISSIRRSITSGATWTCRS